MKMRIISIVLMIFFFTNILNSSENKILIKVDNKIITTIDLYNEVNFLKSINQSLEKMKDEQIFEIAKKSLIKERVKEIFLSKIFGPIELDKSEYKKILVSTYSKRDVEDYDQLKSFLKDYDVEVKNLEKKLTINTFWNEMIIKKYANIVKIDKDKIKKDLIKDNKQFEYNISEILFKANKDDLDNQYKLINDSIVKNSFENTALMFSLSDTSSKGGLIGWVKENSINEKIRSKLKKIDIGNITEPILVQGGILILKINDKRKVDKLDNLENEINAIARMQRNIQLNRYSDILFNKVEKNTIINEL